MNPRAVSLALLSLEEEVEEENIKCLLLKIQLKLDAMHLQ